MDLSIIIPSFNTKQLLDRCLASIYAGLKDSSVTFEIIVVDNASDDGTRELLKSKYTRVINIFNKNNRGYGKANNQGIVKAKGEYILLLNSDIQAVGTAIESLLTFAKLHKHSFVGGKLLNEDSTPQASCGPMYTLPVVFLMLFAKGDTLGITRSSPRKEKSVGWVSGACLLGSKKAFLATGLFDEGIFMYMEDIEFLYRAGEKGYTTFFCPNASFIHTGAASSGDRKTPILNIYQGLLYFYTKHYSTWNVRLLRILLTLKALAGMLVGRMIGRKDLYTLYEEAYRMV